MISTYGQLHGRIKEMVAMAEEVSQARNDLFHSHAADDLTLGWALSAATSALRASEVAADAIMRSFGLPERTLDVTSVPDPLAIAWEPRGVLVGACNEGETD